MLSWTYRVVRNMLRSLSGVKGGMPCQPLSPLPADWPPGPHSPALWMRFEEEGWRVRLWEYSPISSSRLWCIGSLKRRSRPSLDSASQRNGGHGDVGIDTPTRTRTDVVRVHAD